MLGQSARIRCSGLRVQARVPGMIYALEARVESQVLELAVSQQLGS